MSDGRPRVEGLRFEMPADECKRFLAELAAVGLNEAKRLRTSVKPDAEMAKAADAQAALCTFLSEHVIAGAVYVITLDDLRALFSLRTMK